MWGGLVRKGYLFRLQVHERAGISLVKLNEMGGKSIISGVKGPKGLIDAFHGREKADKTFWFYSAFTTVKKPTYLNRLPFVNRRYTKGCLFCRKWYIKG